MRLRDPMGLLKSIEEKAWEIFDKHPAVPKVTGIILLIFINLAAVWMAYMGGIRHIPEDWTYAAKGGETGVADVAWDIAWGVGIILGVLLFDESVLGWKKRFLRWPK